MAKGLAIPVRAVNGRAALTDGADQMRKIIMLALGEGESTNPFNGSDVGMDAKLFRLDLPAMRSLTRRAVDAHFRRFQANDRAQLIAADFLKSEGGELNLFVRYSDLETDEEQLLDRTVRRA